jgi:hypothetical protein
MSSDDPTVPYGYCHCGCGEKTTLAVRTLPARGQVKGEPNRYCQGHGRRSSPVEYIEEDCGYDTPCWTWQLCKSIYGYGLTGRDGKLRGAHRSYYEQFRGPIPKGLQLDHLCRNPACVNPAHLEAVTQTENIRRGKNTKLTAESAREIKYSAEDALTLSRRYGVTRECIYGVRNGKSWKDA